MKKRIIPNFPKPNVDFIDLTPTVSSPLDFREVIKKLTDKVYNLPYTPTAILAPASRGYIYAAPVAYKTLIPLVTVMKTNKCPQPMLSTTYNTEYSQDEISIPDVPKELLEHPIFIDDILATGGTLEAVQSMVNTITDAFVVDTVDISPEINNVNIHTL